MDIFARNSYTGVLFIDEQGGQFRIEAPNIPSHLPEPHLQLINPLLPPLLDVEAHLLEEASHRPVG